MMRIAAVLLAVFFAVGLLISAPGSVYAAYEEEEREIEIQDKEAVEEVTQEELSDIDELEKQIEEEDGKKDNYPIGEDEVQEEKEQNYPDEKYR